MAERKLMKGNEAIAEAAIRGGCRFYAGYPITPQNEIPEYMSWRLPQVGGHFIQAESDIAAINMEWLVDYLEKNISEIKTAFTPRKGQIQHRPQPGVPGILVIGIFILINRLILYFVIHTETGVFHADITFTGIAIIQGSG